MQPRRRQPFNVALNANIRQPNSRAVLTGVLNDHLVASSQLTAFTALSDFKLDNLVTLSYTQLVGADGLTFKSSFVNYRGYPTKNDRPGDDTVRYSVNERAQVSVSYPLMLSARARLNA